MPFEFIDAGHELVNQIFMLEYCGLNDTAFWDWCKKPTFEPFRTKCKNIKHSLEEQSCNAIVHFIDELHLEYTERCLLGGAEEKGVNETFTQELEIGKFKEVSVYCLNRVNTWYWWIVALVVLICLLVLVISSWYFWKLVLRPKFAKTDEDKSTVESRFSSASSASVNLPSLYTVGPSGRPLGTKMKMSNMRTSNTKLSSNQRLSSDKKLSGVQKLSNNTRVGSSGLVSSSPKFSIGPRLTSNPTAISDQDRSPPPRSKRKISF